MPRDSRYTTLAASAKLVISDISGRFRGLYPRFTGPARISMPCHPHYTTLEASTKIVILAISGCFRGL